MSFHQAADDLVLLQDISCRMDIIPHGKLREAEIADHAGFHHIPARKGKDRTAHDCKNAFDVDAMLISGKRIQTADLHMIVLRQHLQQGRVEMGVLIPGMQGISLIG